MFFYLSKIGFFVLRPSNALFLLGALGLVLLLTGRQRLARACLVVSICGFGVLGLSPASNLLIQPLEDRFAAASGFPAPDGIIVLGGSVDTIVSSTRPVTGLTSSAERLTVVAELARRYPAARIIHTGGEGLLMASGTSESDGARPLLLSFGIDATRLVMEDKSRNTWENAVLTKELIEPTPGQTWLLVTSAYHMPRSVGVFRKAGWTGLVPFPVDWRTRGPEDANRWFSGLSDGLKRFDIAFREWLGLVAYWLSGRSEALFPAPAATGVEN